MNDSAERRLTSDEAFRAAFYMIDRYLSLDPDSNGDLAALWLYMQTDPARAEDWVDSMQRAIADPGWGADIDPPSRGWDDLDRNGSQQL